MQPTRIREIKLRRAAPGLLLAALGLAGLAIAAGQPFRLPGGRPGPGFVPALLAGALVLLGLLHALAARRDAAPAATAEAPLGGGARAGLLLCAAIAGFALLLPWAGFLPSAWVAGALTLAAAPGARPGLVLAGGGALAGLAAALFLGGLGLPTPLIGAR